MHRDERHVFAAVALAIALLTAGCSGGLSASQSAPSTDATQSPSHGSATPDVASTPVPATPATAGPERDQRGERARERPETAATPAVPTESSAPTNGSAPSIPNGSTSTATRTPTTPATPVPSTGVESGSGASVTAPPAPSAPSTQTPSPTTPSPAPDTSLRSVEVVDVLDGDTVRVRYPDGTTRLVNLVGVDAPDLYGGTDPDEFEGVPHTDGGHQYLYAWAWMADAVLESTLSDRTVEVRVVDSVTPSTDDYPPGAEFDGVDVAYVYADGEQVNRELLRRGVARATATHHPERPAFSDLVAAAQAESRGLWGTDDGLSIP